MRIEFANGNAAAFLVLLGLMRASGPSCENWHSAVAVDLHSKADLGGKFGTA